MSTGSEPSRRSTRERKQVEHFGHDCAESQIGSSSSRPQKRTATLVNDDDDSGFFAPAKRQRLEPSVSKPRMTRKAKPAVKIEVDDRPASRGQPEVWAEVNLIIFSLSNIWLTYFPVSPSALRVLTVLPGISLRRIFI